MMKDKLIQFFTMIRFRKIVKDQQPLPSGPYMIVYSNNERKFGVFWLIPIAIVIRIAMFTNYWYNYLRKKPTFFDNQVIEQYQDGFNAGYIQAYIDRKGTSRQMKMFTDKIKKKSNLELLN